MDLIKAHGRTLVSVLLEIYLMSLTSMFTPTDIERPTGQRLASQYKAIERKELDRSHYPCTLDPTSVFIHDLAYHQSILGNEDNFANQTTCSVFDVNGNGVGLLKPEVHDVELRYYIQARASPCFNSAHID